MCAQLQLEKFNVFQTENFEFVVGGSTEKNYSTLMGNNSDIRKLLAIIRVEKQSIWTNRNGRKRKKLRRLKYIQFVVKKREISIFVQLRSSSVTSLGSCNFVGSGFFSFNFIRCLRNELDTILPLKRQEIMIISDDNDSENNKI